MAAHKFWRIHFPHVGLPYSTVMEVWMRDSGGVDLNVTVGGVASANSEYSGGYLASYAFDRNTSTPWCPAAGAIPSFLQFIFTTPVDIATVDILNTTASSELIGNPSSSWSDTGFSWSGQALMPLLSGSIATGQMAYFGIGSGWVDPLDVAAKTYGFDRHFTGILVPPINVKNFGFQRPEKNFLTGGNGRCWGYVDKDAAPGPNVPLRRKVVLCRQRDNMALQTTWSRASDGFYEFLNVDMTEKHYAIAFDHLNDYRMVGADNLIPEPMQ